MKQNSLTIFLKFLERHREKMILFTIILILFTFMIVEVQSQVKIPGVDQSAKLEAAGTLLKVVDTALFVWLARIFSGLCILSSGWLIKEQKFGPAVVCIIGALIIGTSPMWVINIFNIGGGGGVFR